MYTVATYLVEGLVGQPYHIHVYDPLLHAAQKFVYVFSLF